MLHSTMCALVLAFIRHNFIQFSLENERNSIVPKKKKKQEKRKEGKDMISPASVFLTALPIVQGMLSLYGRMFNNQQT